MACAGVTPRLETRVKRQSPAPVAGLYVSEQKALAGGLSKFVTNSLAIGLSQSWLRKLFDCRIAGPRDGARKCSESLVGCASWKIIVSDWRLGGGPGLTNF
jgi:hypothetical protein